MLVVYIAEQWPLISKRYFQKLLSQFFNTKLSLSVSLFEREHPELAPVPHFCGFQVNSEQEGLKLIENNKFNLQSEFSHCLETSGELLVQSDRRYIHIHTYTWAMQTSMAQRTYIPCKQRQAPRRGEKSFIPITQMGKEGIERS